MFEGLEPPKGNGLCLIGRKATELSEEDLQIFNDALDNPMWTTHKLLASLKERGFIVGYTSINRHRKKECTCAR